MGTSVLHTKRFGAFYANGTAAVTMHCVVADPAAVDILPLITVGVMLSMHGIAFLYAVIVACEVERGVTSGMKIDVNPNPCVIEKVSSASAPFVTFHCRDESPATNVVTVYAIYFSFRLQCVENLLSDTSGIEHLEPQQ